METADELALGRTGSLSTLLLPLPRTPGRRRINMSSRSIWCALLGVLLALSACENGEPQDPVLPIKPIQPPCLELGSPERSVTHWPLNPDLPLIREDGILLLWTLQEACGQSSAVIRGEYSRHLYCCFEELSVPYPCMVPFCGWPRETHAHAPVPISSFRMAHFSVTVYDELGLLGSIGIAVPGPGPRERPGPRIPQERTSF